MCMCDVVHLIIYISVDLLFSNSSSKGVRHKYFHYYNEKRRIYLMLHANSHFDDSLLKQCSGKNTGSCEQKSVETAYYLLMTWDGR